MICPRCGVPQSDGLLECGSCGVIFAKYRRRPEPALASDSYWQMGRQWLVEHMFEVEPGGNPLGILVRGIFLLGLTLWGVSFLLRPLEGEEIMSSFMHLINLPFHEAGHFVFTPFGRFIQVLGGTLGQLLVPLIVLGSFLNKRNAFGGAVAGWWMGQSFLDCAPYINDARAGGLMLVGGVTGKEVADYHDWEVMLGRLGWLPYDHTIARIFWSIGLLMMVASIAWGLFLLQRQWQTRAKDHEIG